MSKTEQQLQYEANKRRKKNKVARKTRRAQRKKK